MAYEAIARKYRPRTFSEVVGQEPIVRTLTNALREKRIHHAYVFSGVRGVGKTTLARIFAKALNCVNGPTAEPCLTCDACTEIAAGRNLDVIEMDAASRTGVDDVRDLIDTTRYAPARDRYKVFIIDEFHMLSKPAFNALLKTLEEPPSRVVFIMATTELNKVLPTVLSRTQQFDFRKVPVAQIADQLAMIAKAEKVEVPRACLDMLARAGDGSVRDAESLLDQAIAFSGATIQEADIRSLLGLAPEETVEAFLAAAAAHDAGAMIRVIADILDLGYDMRLFLAGLIEGTRRLLVLKAAAKPEEILGLSEDDTRRLAALASQFSLDTLLRLFGALAGLEAPMRYAEQPRYLLEAAAVRIATIADLTPIEDLIARIGGAEPPKGPAPVTSGPSASGKASGPAAPGRTAPARAPGDAKRGPRGEAGSGASEVFPEAAGERAAKETAKDVANEPSGAAGQDDPRIAAMLERIHEMKTSLATLVGMAQTVAVRDGTMRILFDESQAFARKSVELPDNLGMIAAAAFTAFGRVIDVKVDRATPDAPPQAPRASAAAPPGREATPPVLAREDRSGGSAATSPSGGIASIPSVAGHDRSAVMEPAAPAVPPSPGPDSESASGAAEPGEVVASGASGASGASAAFPQAPSAGAIAPGTPRFKLLEDQALEDPVVRSVIERFHARITDIKEVP